MAKYGPVATWSQYLGARLVAGALLCADAETGLALARNLAGNAYPLARRHAAGTRAHIRAAFPDWTPEQVERTTREAFKHLAMLGVEVVHTPRALHPSAWEAHVDVSGLAPEAVGLLSARKPALLVTGHIGNWEMLGYSLAVVGYPIHAIARPLDNKRVNDWVFGIRERRGLSILDKDSGALRAHSLLAAGKPVGAVADQDAGPKQGVFVPFLGRLAATHKSVALLAAHAGVPIVCGAAIRQEPGPDGRRLRYRLESTDIIHPEDWSGQEDPVFYITARWARAVETSVKAHPGQYLWMHRRWKTRPKHETEGKPAPAALRRKLEALPWMDQAGLDRLLGSAAPARTASESA